ncbi:MAG: hypothetical protein IPK16_29860 [Anaerolineales bacterium]|nr:hypothetical protein [Anaerolineales bacterium]
MPAHPEFVTLEILIAARTQIGYPVTVVDSPAGEATAFSPIDLSKSRLAADAEALTAGRLAGEARLQEFGRLLFESIFVDEVAHLYRASLSMAMAQGKLLRLHLRFDAPELAALPWEYLYDLQDERLLAVTLDCAVTRSIAVAAPTPALAVQPLCACWWC